VSFDFLDFTFKPRLALNATVRERFTTFTPAVSIKAMKVMNEKMKTWAALKKTTNTMQEIAKEINLLLEAGLITMGSFTKQK
jgi:hypothetical protein